MNMNPFDLNNQIRVGGPGELKPTLSKPVEKGGENAIPFKDMLKGLVDQVDTLQKEADKSIEGLVTGETSNVHDVVVKLEEAGIAFDLMMKVRDKLMDAYQQVLRMQP